MAESCLTSTAAVGRAVSVREEIDTLTNDADLIGKRYERFRKIGADAVMKESV